MNSDELMPDSAADAIPVNNGNGNGNSGAAVTWNTKKFRDDYDMIKIRLTDQRFSSTNFRDPLMPCPPHHRQYPGHTTPATEKRLKELITRIKGGSDE
ncbi:hypothetical protein QBC32DRAFT_310248 [Pseudoneurospora amorphoporcata]|uniref:Uncharacterized protein n=1 Tax=Pseudoneurospora amorphoporcata TaxID=241081 RepID=A0AAN6P227_9PEZI|nr:hypothetical protein QBC32DRAFT_310248 [Pseudoneurospora amorphoporcata]